MSALRILGPSFSSVRRACSKVLTLLAVSLCLCSGNSMAGEQPAEKKLTADEQHQLDSAKQMDQKVHALYSQGKLSGAVELAGQVLETRRKILGEEDPAYAQSLNNLASLHVSMGDDAQAEPLLRKALEINKKTRGPQHPDYARSLNNLGMLYKDREGDYARAEPLLREALEIWKKGPGPRQADYATSLDNLAELYKDQRDYARAEPLRCEALEIRKEALGAQDPEYAASLNNLATLYEAQGKYALAEPRLREALEIRKKAPQHPDYATSLSNLALLYQAQGEYARAEPLLREALDTYKKAVHPAYARSLSNLAMLYSAEGDYVRAEPLLQEALEIMNKALSPRHPWYAASLGNLAYCKLAMHSADGALPLARQAAHIAREHLEQTAIIQSERQQLGMAHGNRWYLDLVLSASRAAGAPADEAYDQVLAWKGAVTDRQGFLRAMRRDVKDQPKTLKLYSELQDATRSLEGAVSLVPPEPQRVEELSQRVEELQQNLAGASAAVAEKLRQRRRTAAELRHSLPERVALVDFVEYSDFSQADETHRKPLSKPRRLMAFVVRRDQPTTSIDVGPAEPLAQAVDVWRAHQIGRPAEGTTAAKILNETLGAWKERQADADPAQKLREWTWDKLPPDVRDPAQTATVLVSPDGALSRFPWAALPGRKPGDYLLEEQGIAVIAVARELPELLAKAAGDDPLPNSRPKGEGIAQPGAPGSLAPDRLAKGEVERRGPSLLIVGDINYGEDPGALLASATDHRGDRPVRNANATWPPLPGTRPEMTAIVDSFGQRFVKGLARTLRKNEATKPAVEELAPKYRYLHFATHGFFADPEVRPLTVRNDRAETNGFLDQARLDLSERHPGLLSGIVLTGANMPVTEDKDDGILTALEVGELNLSAVDLVTLSACETGLGATAGGEGLLGLQRAFQTAGASTTVATLWKASDDPARRVMIEMYDNLWGEKKMSKLEALRQAQLSMLREGAMRGLDPKTEQLPDKNRRLPPYYWAPFVLSGDWR